MIPLIMVITVCAGCLVLTWYFVADDADIVGACLVLVSNALLRGIVLRLTAWEKVLKEAT